MRAAIPRSYEALRASEVATLNLNERIRGIRMQEEFKFP
jgi:hypothetical protein